MLDRSMEQQGLPAPLPECLVSLTSRSSNTHFRTSISSTCTTAISNPLQPQALSSSSSSSSSDHHYQQTKWPTFQLNRLRWVLLVFLCLHNITLIASRSIPESSLTPSLKLTQLHQYSYEAHSGEQHLDRLEDPVHNIESNNRMKRSPKFENNPTLWPNATIPFQYGEGLRIRHKKQIVRAINVLQEKSCIRFVPKTSADKYYVTFELSRTTCFSQTGLKTYLRGRQAVYLTDTCFRHRGTVIHELAHLIGLYHEHQRPDRDQYINILWDNVHPHFMEQFNKLDFDTYGVEYDFKSIMQYSFKSFSQGDRITMVPHSNVTTPAGVIGDQHRPSFGDFKRIKAMYNCPPVTPPPSTTTTRAPTSTPLLSNDLGGFSPSFLLRSSATPTTPPTTAFPTTPTTPPTTPTTLPTTPTTPPTTPTTLPTTPTTPPTTPTTPPTTPTTPPTTPTTPPTTPTTPPTTPTTPPTTPTTPPTTPTTPPTTPTTPPTTPTTPPTTPTTPPTTPTTPPTTPTTPPTTPTTPPTTPTTPPTMPIILPTKPIALPATPTASSTTPRPHHHRIHSGHRVVLRFAEQKNEDKVVYPLWLRCTRQNCSLDSCLNNTSMTNDMAECPYNFFTLHKVSSGTDKRIRVGDKIVLEFMPPSGHQPLSERSMYVTCNSTTQSCGISSTCNRLEQRFFTPYCQGNVIIIKARGKREGQLISSMDILGFEFQLMPSQHFFDDQCALGCNPETYQCSKERCLFLPDFSAGGFLNNQPMRCGKDMFQIQRM